MKATVDIDDDKILSALDSAFYGGSTYWLNVRECAVVQRGTDIENAWAGHVMSGGQLQLVHPNVAKTGIRRTVTILDRAMVERGLQLMSTVSPFQMANLVNDNADADTGDVLLQCAMFGEVIFG